MLGMSFTLGLVIIKDRSPVQRASGGESILEHKKIFLKRKDEVWEVENGVFLRRPHLGYDIGSDLSQPPGQGKSRRP
jgi:hypothetical protein